MDISKSLKDIGFTQNEIDIYSYILKNDLVLGSEVHKKLSINKSSFYRALKNLQKKGLVLAQGETRNQKFKTTPIANLLDLQKQKEVEVKQAKVDIKNFIEDINEYTKNSFKSNNVKVLEGKSAYYIFMEEMLKGKVDVIRDLSVGHVKTFGFAGSQEKYYGFMKTYIKRRVSKGIKIRILYDFSNVGPDKLDRTSSDNLKEARRFRGKLNLECFMNTFGDRVGFFTEKAGDFWCIIIKDRIITNCMNSLFDVLWGQSEVIY